MVSLRTPISREVGSGLLSSGGAERVNVGEKERLLSLIGGGLLGVFGLSRGNLPGLALAALGGGLIYRGLTGHCPAYGALGIDTAGHGTAASIPAGQGVKITRALTINRSPEDLFKFWRNFENLPRFMAHVISVRSEGKRSHWVVRGPLGKQVEWEAETINEEPNRLIAWRSLAGSEVATAGSVHFTPAPGGRGTEVRVEMKYEPPAGKVGALIAKLFGEDPARRVQEDLRLLKELMETSAIHTTQGQPSAAGTDPARRSGSDVGE
jgi:uncharacterized membrane protein